MNGKWYLTHNAWDGMESIGNEVYVAEIPLEAKNEASALKEAKVKWDKIFAKEITYWEKQKREWVHPPKGPFHGLDPDPYVIYKYKVSLT